MSTINVKMPLLPKMAQLWVNTTMIFTIDELFCCITLKPLGYASRCVLGPFMIGSWVDVGEDEIFPEEIGHDILTTS